MTLNRPPATAIETSFFRSQPKRADIQGLRAVAVLLVVLFHSGVSIVSGGYVGVGVFFVISGFLITGHLMSALRNDGRIDFAAFYARRARRILPASFSVLVLSVLAAFIWLPPVLLKSVVQGAIATALYAPNLLFAVQGTNYLSSSAPSVFQHYWSLGVEEQFYLLWPAVLALAFFAVRRSQRRMLFVLVGITAASFVVCLLLTTSDQPWAFFAPWTRAWELGAGGLAAMFVENRSRPVGRILAAIAVWIGIGGLTLAVLAYNDRTLYPGWAATLPVLSTVLIIVGGSNSGPRTIATRLLSTKPMQFVGKISYSVYLVHWPLLAIPAAALGPLNALPVYSTLLLGAVSLPLGWLLYRFVELPGQHNRFLTSARPRRSLVAAATASLLVVALTGSAFFVESKIPLSVDRSVAQSALSSPPIETTFVPKNISPSLRHADGDNPAIYNDGCHRGFASTDSRGCNFGTNGDAPVVVLFGDSHAAQWFPALDALAQRGNIRLEVDTKSSCPSVNIRRYLNGSLYGACETWRSGVIARLRDSPPALVLIANYGQADLGDSPAESARQWKRGLASTLKSLPSKSKIAVIADTPGMQQVPAVCLSTHIADTKPCGDDRRDAISRWVHSAEAEASRSSGAEFIDMNDYFCGATFCPVIIGRDLVYRDQHHLTVTFSKALSAPLGEHLLPLLLARSTGGSNE